MYIFYVQGGGLGHLTRIDKLIQRLNIPVKGILIITPSIFTHHFKDYTFKTISWNCSVSDWTKTIIGVLETHTVTNFYIDTFPLGIKGELIQVFNAFKSIKYIYVSRILKWNTYLSEMPKKYVPRFYKTYLLEYLYNEHYDWILQHSHYVEALNIYNIAEKRESQSSEEPYALLIHSGGSKELLQLCHRVANDSALKNVKVRVFTQVSIVFENPLFEFITGVYPINKYLNNAVKIYTAAGFNSLHELKPYANKHVALPLDKLFDDQFYRVENFKSNRHI